MPNICWIATLAAIAFSGSAVAEGTFYTGYKDHYVYLTDENPPPQISCPSMYYRAVEANLVLGKLTILRELCYRVDNRKAVVEFKDPEKTFFGSFSISANLFVRIPSQKEREEGARAAERQAQAQAMEEWIQQNRAQNTRRAEALFAPMPSPVTCVHLGQITTCN